MVRLVRSHIAVGIRIPVVIHGFTVIILHGSIKGTLNSSLQIYSPLDRLIILRRKDLDFLYMKPGLQAAGGNAVSIRVLRFPHGSLPAKKICHGHGIFSAFILSQRIIIMHGHMIH